MKRNISFAMAAAAVAAAVAGAVWLAVPAGASSAVGPAVSGTEQFQSVNASATASTQGVIAFGAFTAPGVDHIIDNNTDKFVFPGGTFKIRHSNGTGTQTFNPRTCLFTASIHGTYKLSGGTGKYARISGHGTYHFTVLGIAARSGGKCSMTKLPVAFQQIINASGPVSL